MTITDEDLVLYHYRDGLDDAQRDAIARALAESAPLRARLAALERTLGAVDAAPDPEPAPGFEQRLWSRLEPRIAPRAARPHWTGRLREWLAPRPAFAAAFALALAVMIGYYAGRRAGPEAPVAPPLAQAAGPEVSARVLDAYVAAHLRSTEGLLLTAANSTSPELLAGNRELAESLVASNRLYALAAARAGNVKLAEFLRQLEPVLIDLANQSPGTSIGSGAGLREYLDKTDLLFQVRATQARIDPSGVVHRT